MVVENIYRSSKMNLKTDKKVFKTIIFRYYQRFSYRSYWVKWRTLEFFQGHHGLKVSQLSLSDTGHIHMSFLAGKHELCGKSSMWYLGSNFHLSVASTWLTKLYVLTLCVQCWICGHCTSSWKFPLWTQNTHAPLMMLSLDLGCLTPSCQCTQLILSGISHSWDKAELVCNYIPHHCSLFHLGPCCCKLLFLIEAPMSKKPCRCGDWSDGPIQCPPWLLVVVPLSVESFIIDA